MARTVRFIFKLPWRTLCLALGPLAMVLGLTVGFVWGQTLGRSTVHVRRYWNDRGVGRVR